MRLSPFVASTLTCGFAALALGLPARATSDFVVATDPVAFGNRTVTIYVDGPNGGTIDWDNAGVDEPFPEGACGFRIGGNNMPGSDNDPNDDSGWAWYGGYVDVQGDPLVVLVDGVDRNGMDIDDDPGNYLEFTGPYGGDCENGYAFHTPATPDSLPPPGAVALVIQFYDWDDIEFLDSGFQPFSVPENPWPADDFPEPMDICEIAPFLCEEEPQFVSCEYIETINGPIFTCGGDEEEAGLIRDLGFVAGWSLGEVADFVGRQPGRAGTTLPVLKTTRQRLQAAEQHFELLRRDTASREASAAESIQRSRLAVALDLATRRVASCESGVAGLAKSRQPSQKQTLAVVERCREAAGSASSVHRSSAALHLLLADGAVR